MKIQLILYITANGKRQSTDRSAIHAIPISVYTPIIVSTACTFWRRCKASYHGDRRVKTHRIYISADAKPTEATKSAHHLNPATSRENCNVNVNVDFEASNAVTINCHTFSIRSWCCSNIHQFNVIVNTEYRIAVTVVVVPLPLSSLSLPSLQGTGLTQGHRGRSMYIGRRSERIRTMREHFSDTGGCCSSFTGKQTIQEAKCRKMSSSVSKMRKMVGSQSLSKEHHHCPWPWVLEVRALGQSRICKWGGPGRHKCGARGMALTSFLFHFPVFIDAHLWTSCRKMSRITKQIDFQNVDPQICGVSLNTTKFGSCILSDDRRRLYTDTRMGKWRRPNVSKRDWHLLMSRSQYSVSVKRKQS